MLGETNVIVVSIPPGRLSSFRGRGWVGVETFPAERTARVRFHALAPALNGLGAGAVLVRAVLGSDLSLTDPRPLVSKDAEFWRLRGADLRMADREQIEEWLKSAAALIAQDEAKALSRRPGKKVVQGRGIPWPALATAGLAAVATLFIGFVVLLPGKRTVETAVPRSNTIFLSDPRDPSVVIEYELSPDGSRRPLRRITREEHEAGPARRAEAGGEPRNKTLADGINVFLRVRQ
ncbi:hypothetical protein [Alsobacter sp. R-9]